MFDMPTKYGRASCSLIWTIASSIHQTTRNSSSLCLGSATESASSARNTPMSSLTPACSTNTVFLIYRHVATGSRDARSGTTAHSALLRRIHQLAVLRLEGKHRCGISPRLHRSPSALLLSSHPQPNPRYTPVPASLYCAHPQSARHE